MIDLCAITKTSRIFVEFLKLVLLISLYFATVKNYAKKKKMVFPYILIRIVL